MCLIISRTSHSELSWKMAWRFVGLKNSTCNYHKFKENQWKITVTEFNFGKAFSFYSAALLKIISAANIFQGFYLAFVNIFFQELLWLTASLSLLKSVNSILSEVIYWQGILKTFGIFLGKQPCSHVISIKLHCNFM